MGLDDIFGYGAKILDKVIPDPVARDQAKLELLKAQQAGEFKELEEAMSAIRAEAQSADPWTSRARPSFMYVIYIMLLAGLPMGIVSAVNPEVAANIATGFKSWLAAIPDSLYALFGAGYVGYAGFRTYEKTKGAGR